MSRLIHAARNGALAAAGLYLIVVTTLLVLSYASLYQSAPSLAPSEPLHSLASHLPALLGVLSRS